MEKLQIHLDLMKETTTLDTQNGMLKIGKKTPKTIETNQHSNKLFY